MTKAMSDGYSTAGTMGGGMGAMKRIATSLEVFTGRSGTIVLLELGSPSKQGGVQVAGMAIPYPGERLCGDAWTYHQTSGTHGDSAGGWSGPRTAGCRSRRRKRWRFSGKRVDRPPGEILVLRARGVEKDARRGGCGCRNSSARKNRDLCWRGKYRGFVVSHRDPGAWSRTAEPWEWPQPKIQEFKMDWPADAMLIMHSDGLQTRWDLSSYSGLLARHPAVIGAALFRDFRRQRDDASVVVVKAAA